MNRIYYLLIVAMFFGAFAVAAPLRASAAGTYPNGLNGSSDVISGIYPGDNAGNCCWMGRSAILRLSIPRGADTLLLNVYLPKYAAPRNGQTLRVQIGQDPVQVRCCLGAGEHELVFHVGGNRQPSAVRIRASSTFVPKAIGLNQDPRHLSVLLRSVALENASTGERFDTGALPWLPPRISLALLCIAAVLIFALTLRRPMWGLAALILTDPFLFSYSIHGTTVTLPKVALLAVLAGLAARGRVLASLRTWQTVTVLAAAQVLFIVTMIAASPYAVFHAAALRETLKAVEYVMTLLVAYAAYRLDPDEDAVRVCLSLVTIAATLLAVAQLFAGAIESEIIAGHTVTRIAGPLEGPNQFAGFLGVLVPAMVAFSLYRTPLVIERIAITLGTLACLMTFSRGGVGALVLAIAVLFMLRYAPKWRNTAGLSIATLFIVVLVLAFGVFTGTLHGRAQSLFGHTGDDAFNGGLGSRIDLWHGAYAMWRANPLFGIGPGNFEYAIGRYDPGVRTHANGMYFQALAEQGIAGFIAMLAVVAASIAVFVRRLNEPLALGAFAAAIAMAFHQIVDCMWLYPKVGVIWWIVLALGAAAADLRTRAENLAERAVA